MIRTIPTPSSELEAFRAARAEAWRYALACLAENRHEGKEAAHPDGPDDAMKGSNDDRALPEYT